MSWSETWGRMRNVIRALRFICHSPKLLMGVTAQPYAERMIGETCTILR
jgi:hypothetical protein